MEDTLAQQSKPRLSVHLPLDELQFSDVSFDHSTVD